MGLYIQFQRRAIESFWGEPEAISPPSITDIEQIHNLDGHRLYYAGVSEGIGTCSDMLGVDVLVLANNPTTASCETGRLACAYTVLVRKPTPEESSNDKLARLGLSRLCIELLKPELAQSGDTVVFEPTGKRVLYTAVI